MSIQFDQVEGVVQRDEAPTSSDAASTSSPAAPARPCHEQFLEQQRRHDWLTRRVAAD